MSLEAFIDYLQKEKRYSGHTLSSYRNDLTQFWAYQRETFDANHASEVSHLYIRSWIVHLMDQGITPRTVNRKLSALKSYYKYLLRQGEVEKNPTLKIEPPKAKKRLPAFLDMKQAARLLEQVEYGDDLAGMRDRMIIELLYSTGIRRAELVGLKDEDVDVARGQIKVLGKGNKERLIPIGPPLTDTITAYRKQRDEQFAASWFILNDKGGQISAYQVYQIVKKFLNLVTTLDKKSPHVLRHTFATHLNNNGADLNAIKDLLGHSSLAATQVYTHNNIEQLKEIYKKSHPKA